jgi:LPS-assembly lipoprotein
MWSSERSTARLLFATCAIAVAGITGGCNVSPLYGTASITGTSMSTALADVDVAPIEGRVSQQVRNDLLFMMNGGDPGNGTYIVDLQIKEKYANVITRTISGLPGARNIRLTVSYKLTRQDDPGTVLSAGTVQRIASFDYFNQRFANDRASINAEDRAAREAASDVYLRIASYFATGEVFTQAPPPPAVSDEVPTFGNSVFDEQENTYGAPPDEQN